MKFKRTAGLVMGAAMLITGIAAGAPQASANAGVPLKVGPSSPWTTNCWGYTCGMDFQPNGGYGHVAMIHKNADYEPMTLPKNEFSHDDFYEFAGWNTRADGNGETYQPGQSIASDVRWLTFYARWVKKEKVKISFDNMGGIGGDQFKEVKSGEGLMITNRNSPIRAGYIFDGWAWNPTDGITRGEYHVGDYIPASCLSHDISIYAKWIKA